MAAPLVAAAAKWAAKKTAKKALAKGSEGDAGNGLMKVGGLMVVGVGFMVLLMVFVLVGAVITLLGALGGASAGAAQLASCNTTVSDPSGAAVADIPPVAMDAYQKAATASGIDWIYIAAIGKIESDHGRTGGRHLDPQGNVKPTPILGPQTAYGRAEGPMQFLSSTWASVGRDGNFDGKKDSQNIFDAALTTGFYLKASGAPGDMRAAIFAYNHANWYVDKVMAQAQAYQNAPTTSTTITLPAANTNTNPGGAQIGGQVAVADANIPTRSTASAYRATVGQMVANNPDFVTLNEQSARSLSFIKSAAPGYDAYREPQPTDDDNSMGNVVLWKTSAYTQIDGGRVQLVNDDHTTYQGRPVVWDRFATWAVLQRKSDGASVSVIAAHLMTNPEKFGPDKPKRQAQYGAAMDILTGLVTQLSTRGPVFVAGDMNSHVSQQSRAWSAAAKMAAAGYDWSNDSADFIFFPKTLGVTMKATKTGPTPEPDHRWVFARFALPGASPSPNLPGIGGRPNVVTPPTTAQITNAVTAAQAAPGWTMPMKPGTYTLTAHWGQPGSMWSKGYHTGQDFAAPVGTPMYAIGPGKVILRPDQASWAGPNFLMVDHGMVGGHHVISWYAHMSSLAAGIHTGTVVQAGTALGFVGALGNVTGPHLHLEVHVDGPDVDPMIFLTGAGVPSGSIASDNCGPQGSSGIANGNGAWGGYQNGQIPLSAMCQLSFDPAYLECNAAKSMELLNAAYTKKFGRSVGPVGGYRSYADQVKCQEEKGSLCATPGTSNHGWGLAADLDGGGINKFGTPQHNWMVKKAGGWGWVLPAWAQANGSKPEPWHWEYMGTGNTASVATPVGGINPAITAPPSTSGSASFIFGDWNMLGAAHTDAGGNKEWQPDSATRTPNEVRAIRQRDISVITMQEFEGKQQDQFKNIVGSSWAMAGNNDNMVAWRTADWKLVAKDAFQIPYFDGNQRSMPIVRLQSRTTGTEIIVISVHNPADVQWSTHNAENRAAAVKIEGNLTNYLASSGVPVYFAGDMNDRKTFFCSFMAYGAFNAAAGGSYSGTCNPPGYNGIDWIMGGKSNITFSDHNVDNLGIQYSDHPIVYTHTIAAN